MGRKKIVGKIKENQKNKIQKKKKKKTLCAQQLPQLPWRLLARFFFFCLPVKTGKTGKKNLMFLEILAKPAKPAKSKGQEKILNAMGPTRTALSLSILFL